MLFEALFLSSCVSGDPLDRARRVSASTGAGAVRAVFADPVPYHGAEVLPRVIAWLSEPVLFWLGAHYPGGITARGPVDTPIAQEWQTMFKHQDRSHVVLIDDAHEFVGENGYPIMDDLRAFVESSRPDVFVEVRDNIIRLSPSRGIR